uniref:transmembrane protein 95 isoform X2 n=1 Tax=Podarcis muralis TaxID=64176 RepID=UPI00109FE7E3|nr:transmembrane protein 95 isoform X2 [Podarcis muralis]
MSLDLLLEKTHRVFRVIEINQSLADFPKFWNWLHEVKIPEQSREALCPPACQGGGLEKITRLICSISGSCLFLGIVSCALEFWLRANTREEEGPV